MKPRLTPSSRILIAGALLVVAGILAGPAAAQTPNDDASIGLFLADPSSRPCNVKLPACEDPSVQVSGDLYTPYYAYLCVFKGNAQEGIGGLQLSLSYDGGVNSGVDVSSWSLCATLEFPSGGWPAPRTGNTITWDPANSCQQDEPGGFGTGVTALAGWFYVTAYGDDKLSVIARTVDGKLKLATCASVETLLKPEQGGFLGFSSDGSVKGKLPCSSRAIEDATWGRIKDEYGGDRR